MSLIAVKPQKNLDYCEFCQTKLTDDNRCNQHIIPNALSRNFDFGLLKVSKNYTNSEKLRKEQNSLVFANDRMSCETCEHKIGEKLKEKYFIDFFQNNKTISGEVLINNLLWIFFKRLTDLKQRCQGHSEIILKGSKNPKALKDAKDFFKNANSFIPNQEYLNILERIVNYMRAELKAIIEQAPDYKRQLLISCVVLPIHDKFLKNICISATIDDNTNDFYFFVICGLLIKIEPSTTTDILKEANQYTYPRSFNYARCYQYKSINTKTIQMLKNSKHSLNKWLFPNWYK